MVYKLGNPVRALILNCVNFPVLVSGQKLRLFAQKCCNLICKSLVAFEGFENEAFLRLHQRIDVRLFGFDLLPDRFEALIPLVIVLLNVLDLAVIVMKALQHGKKLVVIEFHGLALSITKHDF